MKIGPDTRVFVSVSARPGHFGATVYNTLFEREGIDAVYIPRLVPGTPEEIIASVRSMGLAGCSVSSPHKAGVLPLLDTLEPDAELAGAVNTIYRDRSDRLVGACTDIDGVFGALAEPVRQTDVRSVLIFGSGGVVGPAIVALRRLGVEDISICARNGESARETGKRFRVDYASNHTKTDLVINATPAGITSAVVPVLSDLAAAARVFLDMTVTPGRTAIVAHAASHGVVVRDGVDMCTAQITAQAARYLGRSVDASAIRDIVVGSYLTSK